MLTYRAPLREISFIQNELLAAESAGLGGPDPAEAAAILQAAARFCESDLLPLNGPGDAEGCRWQAGDVTTPAGFREAYQRWCEGGWTGLAADPVWGGQGLPAVVQAAVDEMLSASNLSFSIYPGLSAGAYNALSRHAPPEVQGWALPPLVAGRWSGTMCLTEPQCGTDLGLLRTRADPGPEGRYRITGSKIFISAGEHDLTENILHLVLARLPDAPAGVKGISLFLVPKVLPDGTRNPVLCTGIEHKMGIRASATCSMSFDGAEGWLIGAAHQGLRCMFTMMNAARLGVGIQGLGIAEVAGQSAVAYARQRSQGVSPDPAKRGSGPADPLLVHPDIRAMLLRMRAMTEAGRAMAYWLATQLDRAARDPDEEARQRADDLAGFLTPLVKAMLTDHGSEAANLAVQCHGGHGYIVEQGVEQLIRDARITQIYEGANGIQALDLVGRKLGLHYGRLLRGFFHPAAALIAELGDDPALRGFVQPFAKAFGRLQQITASLAERGHARPEEAAAVATDYARLTGLVVCGYLWCRMAALAERNKAGEEAGFYQAKLATGRFFMEKILPETGMLAARIAAGGGSITDFPEAAF